MLLYICVTASHISFNGNFTAEAMQTYFRGLLALQA